MQQGKCVGTTDLVRHDLDALLSLFPFEKVGNHSFFFLFEQTRVRTERRREDRRMDVPQCCTNKEKKKKEKSSLHWRETLSSTRR